MIFSSIARNCEFCAASFFPRVQVKNPRACTLPKCQVERQRSNELAWREQNSTSRDAQYHRLRKRARLKQFIELARLFTAYLKTGVRFLNANVSMEFTEDLLFQFFKRIGIRKINKFWPEGFPQQSQSTS